MANYYLGHTGAQLDEAVRKVLSGELDVPLQAKSVTPTTSQQVVAPDSAYKGLSQVTVEAIPQSYTDEVYNQGYEAGYNAEKPYQMELEYIESTGTQYIDTGFKPNQDTRVVMDTQMLASGTQFLFGARGSSTEGYNKPFAVLLNATGNFRSDFNGSNVVFDSIATTDRWIVDKNKNVCQIGNLSVTSTASTFQSAYNLFLFAICEGGSAAYFAKMRFGGCQIYDNGTLIRDYIPVLDSEGVPCLYDKVNKTFAYNAGTGTFKYPGSTPVVNSITTTGTYNQAAYHGDYWAAIDNNGNLLLCVTGGTNTSYESISFATSSVPSGVSLVNQSYHTYASMTASALYVAVYSGITSSVDITLNFSGVNSNSDYVTCTVTIT